MHGCDIKLNNANVAPTLKLSQTPYSYNQL